MKIEHPFLRYLAKLLVAFFILYAGTFAWIGFAAPGGIYSPFIDQYLNYPAWLRASLLWGARTLLQLFGYHPYKQDAHVLVLRYGISIRMVYACLGYGVMSLWGAFIFANRGSWQRKLKWIIGGWLTIWAINVVRCSVYLIALSKHTGMPFGMEVHTWFNVISYLAIGLMVWVWDRGGKQISN